MTSRFAMEAAVDHTAVARHSSELERAGEAVIEAKQLLVDLDRRANQFREASRAIGNSYNFRDDAAHAASKSSHEEVSRNRAAGRKPLYVLCAGATFVKGTVSSVSQYLRDDQRKTKDAIENARSELKQRVVELAELEGPDSAIARLNAGFELRPQ